MKTFNLLFASFLAWAFIPLSAQDIFKAISTGDLNQVKTIISETPELLNVKNEKSGLTAVEMAFMYEMQKNKLEIAPFLIENGAQFEVDKKNRFGYTTLDMAIIFGCLEATEYLINLGAEMNLIRQRDGKPPLINAITRGRDEIAIALIKHGAEINTPDREGNPPMYFAVKKGQLHVIEKLLDGGARLNFTDDQGRTYLHLSSLNGYYDVVNLLLKAKPDIDALDNADRSAHDYASMYGHKRIAGLLTDHGAKERQDIEKNFGKSEYLTKKLNNGDAVAWYLNNRGWAIKTQNHLIVFDSEEFGVKRPTEPLLANGFLSPFELADQNIVAIYTAYHGEIGEPAYIHTIEDSVSKIQYIHNKRDRWRGTESTKYMESREEKRIDDLQLIPVSIQEKMPVLGYWCKVDGVTMFYSGFRPEDIDKYKLEIDFLAQSAGEIDLAFYPIAEPGEENVELIYLIEKLHPRIIFPLDPNRREYLFPGVKNMVKELKPDVQVNCAENPGDHFYFKSSD